MTVARLQHSFNAKNGLAADAVINTFHFESIVPGLALTVAEAQQLRDAVLGFYDVVPAGISLRLAEYLAMDSFATPRHGFRVYNMADAEPRQPVITETHAGVGTVIASTSLPAEVAVCLSYKAESVSGQVPARRRGRIYIGPLNTTVLFEDAQGHSRPIVDLRNVLVNAAKQLQVDAQAAGWNWVVRHGGVSEDGVGGGGTFPSHAEITTAWCDDAFDTQRRRGPKATVRTTMAV